MLIVFSSISITASKTGDSSTRPLLCHSSHTAGIIVLKSETEEGEKSTEVLWTGSSIVQNDRLPEKKYS